MCNVEIENLSPEAQKLIELFPVNERAYGKCETPDVSAYLQEHPEFIPGLNEYLDYVKRQSQAIAESKSIPLVAHSVVNAIKAAGSQKIKLDPRKK